MVQGFAWFAYPDPFRDESQPVGHPFADGGAGAVQAPPEVVFFQPVRADDAGIHNESQADSYLVVTKTMLHPKTNKGWEVDPASLTDKYKTADNAVRITRVIQVHKTRQGEVIQGEFKVAAE
jgi:hypothetical protein